MPVASRRVVGSRAAVLCVAVLAGVVTGCTFDRDADDGPDGSTVAIDVATLAAESSAFQREILVDWHVTFAEYERAVGMAVECLRARGMEVTPPEPRGGDPRFLDFSFQLQRSDGQQGQVQHRMLDGYETCAGEYLADVERVWFRQHQLPPAERERQRGQLIECLQGAGLEVSREAPHHEVHHEVEHHVADPAVQACRQQHPDYFVPEV